MKRKITPMFPAAAKYKQSFTIQVSSIIDNKVGFDYTDNN